MYIRNQDMGINCKFSLKKERLTVAENDQSNVR